MTSRKCMRSSDRLSQSAIAVPGLQQEPMTDNNDHDWDAICSEFRVDRSSILRHAHSGPGNARARMASELLINNL
jgi:hypothetical protein